MFHMCSASGKETMKETSGAQNQHIADRSCLGGGRKRRPDDQAARVREHLHQRRILPRHRRGDQGLFGDLEVAAQVILTLIIFRQFIGQDGFFGSAAGPAGRPGGSPAAPGTDARRQGSRPDFPAALTTCIRPSRPDISGLPGRIAIFQKIERHAARHHGLLHEVMIAHRGAADGHKHVGALRYCRIKRRVERLHPVGGDAEIDHLGARAAGKGCHAKGVRGRMIWPGPRLSPGRRNSSPVASTATFGRRAIGKDCVVHRRGEGDGAGVEQAPGLRSPVLPVSKSTPRLAGCAGRRFAASLIPHGSVVKPLGHFLDDDGVGALGQPARR